MLNWKKKREKYYLLQFWNTLQLTDTFKFINNTSGHTIKFWLQGIPTLSFVIFCRDEETILVLV